MSLDAEEMKQAIQAMQEGKGDDIQDRVTANFEKLPQFAQEQWLQNHDFKIPPGADMLSTGEKLKIAEAGKPETAQAPQQKEDKTPELLLKAEDQAHNHEMDKAKLALEAAKIRQAGEIADKQHQVAVKAANKPVPKPASAKPASKPKAKAK
jgi:hypothetical protein